MQSMTSRAGALSSSAAVTVPRRRGYDPGQDAIYLSQQSSSDGSDLADSGSVGRDSAAQLWDLRVWRRSLGQTLAESPDLQSLTSKSVDDNSGKLAKKRQKRLDLLLCCAAAAGNLDKAALLLQAGADPMCASGASPVVSKPTSFHWAASCRQVAAFVLLQNGALYLRDCQIVFPNHLIAFFILFCSALARKLGSNPVPAMIQCPLPTPFDLLADDLDDSRLNHWIHSVEQQQQAGDVAAGEELEYSSGDSRPGPAVSYAWKKKWTRAQYLFSSGQSSNGTLGRGERGGSNWPKRVTGGLGAASVTSISCSQYVSACTTANGDLYTWGLGTGDRLGQSGRPASLNEPTLLSDGSACFTHVSVSTHHAAAVTADGALYCWGRGSDGQLGFGASEVAVASGTDSSDSKGDSATREFFSPLNRVKSLRAESIRSVFCAERHTVAVTHSGRVFTFGYGATGALGHGPPAKDEHSPRLVTSLLNTTVCSHLVAVGPRHTCLVTTSRDLYVFGFGNPTPRRIQFSFGYPSLNKGGFVASAIASVSSQSRRQNNSASVDEILILSDLGEIYSYLEGIDPYPISIHAAAQPLSARRFVRIFASEEANYAITALGAVFKFRPRSPSRLEAISFERLPLIQRVEEVCASRAHVLYRVAGPVTPPGGRIASSESESEALTHSLLRLFKSQRDSDVVLRVVPIGSDLQVRHEAEGVAGGFKAHSWILSRVPMFAQHFSRIRRRDGAIISVQLPVSLESALPVLLQWLYTDRIWTSRAMKEEHRDGADIQVFRHELHLKPLAELSQLLKIPSLAKAINASTPHVRVGTPDIVPLASHMRRQFVSPVGGVVASPVADSIDRSRCVEISLTSDEPELQGEPASTVVTGVAVAHRCMLALRSDYFATMLDGSWSESARQEMQLNAVSPAAFHLLLSFVYSHSLFESAEEKDCLWSPQVAFELLALSDELLLPDLAVGVEQHLLGLLKPDSAARLYEAGSTYRAEELQKSVANYMALNTDLLLRLHALNDLHESVLGLEQLQRHVDEVWAEIPFAALLPSEAQSLTRVLSDLGGGQRQPKTQTELSRKASSPSSVAKSPTHFSSPPIQTSPAASVAISPPAPPLEASSPPVPVSPPAASPWAPVSLDSPKRRLNDIVQEEQALQQSKAVPRKWGAASSPGHPTALRVSSELPASSVAGQDWPSLAPVVTTSVQTRVGGPPNPGPKKRGNKITISWAELAPKSQKTMNANAPAWQPPTSTLPAVSAHQPQQQPNQAVQLKTSQDHFPALGTPTSKPSLKDIIQEQKKQGELLAQKVRPLAEILEEEALLAEHTRVEQYYESLKKEAQRQQQNQHRPKSGRPSSKSAGRDLRSSNPPPNSPKKNCSRPNERASLSSQQEQPKHRAKTPQPPS